MRIRTENVKNSTYRFTYKAYVQYFDGMSYTWRTVGVCYDTPSAIQRTLRKAREDYPDEELWVYSTLDRTRYHISIIDEREDGW